jgi:hypothetical protein
MNYSVRYHFEEKESANKFIAARRLKNYKFETPKFINKGIDLIVLYNSDEGFICEVCGDFTPFDCEGGEPNVCEACYFFK